MMDRYVYMFMHVCIYVYILYVLILDDFTEKQIGRSTHGQVPIPGTGKPPEADTSVPLVTWHFDPERKTSWEGNDSYPWMRRFMYIWMHVYIYI